MSHLQVPQRGPQSGELVVELWDEAETGVGCKGCNIVQYPTAQGTTIASADGRYVVITRSHTRTGFDRVQTGIVGWVSDAKALSLYELGRPLHSELLLWHRDRGLQAIHAGLVGRGQDGLLLGGPGGSGKSTTALTSLLAGLAYLADDYVAVEQHLDGRLTGHSVYCSTHLTPEHLLRFPDLAPYAIPGQLTREDKSLLLLSDMPNANLQSSVTIRAMAFPVVTDSTTTRFRPASRAHALLRLAPSSIMLLPYPDTMGESFKNLAALVERIPVYWLELGRDLAQIPEAVAALIDEVTD